jgi:putative tryptophan/tyrosine transport system substrate-binding protein
MLPSLHRVGALGNAADPFSKPFLEQVQLTGRRTGIDIATSAMVRGTREIEAALENMEKEGAGAVVLQGSLASKNVADLAVRYAAATSPRSFAEAGGLLSYSADSSTSFWQSARFVTKILQGGLPADMPIEQPTKFELVINLKTARTLGLTVAETFLQRADMIIE